MYASMREDGAGVRLDGFVSTSDDGLTSGAICESGAAELADTGPDCDDSGAARVGRGGAGGDGGVPLTARSAWCFVKAWASYGLRGGSIGARQ